MLSWRVGLSFVDAAPSRRGVAWDFVDGFASQHRLRLASAKHNQGTMTRLASPQSLTWCRGRM